MSAKASFVFLLGAESACGDLEARFVQRGRLMSVTDLPPEALPGQDEEHDHHVGGDADAGHQEEDGGRRLGVLLADDDRHVGRVAALLPVPDPQARDGPRRLAPPAPDPHFLLSAVLFGCCGLLTTSVVLVTGSVWRGRGDEKGCVEAAMGDM